MTILIKEVNLVYQEEEMTYVVKTFFSFQRVGITENFKLSPLSFNSC